jgi:hypothetical protein
MVGKKNTGLGGIDFFPPFDGYAHTGYPSRGVYAKAREAEKQLCVLDARCPDKAERCAKKHVCSDENVNKRRP